MFSFINLYTISVPLSPLFSGGLRGASIGFLYTIQHLGLEQAGGDFRVVGHILPVTTCCVSVPRTTRPGGGGEARGVGVETGCVTSRAPSTKAIINHARVKVYFKFLV